MKRLRTLNLFQIYSELKLKNQKLTAVDVLFKAYPMVPLSCGSNLAGRYLNVRLPASLFYIERDPHSRTKIGGRDILAVHKNEAMVA